MFGFTGTWRGQPVSVQGSGMGQPSLAIYANELFREYDVQSIIRVGSCGALTEKVGDPRHRHRLRRLHRLVDEPDPLRGPRLRPGRRLRAAARGRDAAAAARPRDDVHVGLIFSSDSFYPARPELMTRMVEYGVLAVEMEASALYTIAAGTAAARWRSAPSPTTSSPARRPPPRSASETFGDMVEIALTAAVTSGVVG